MPKATAPVAALFALSVATVFATAGHQRPEVRTAPILTAHEWGTFTTVAGEDGRSVEWLPLGGPNDLPCFVNVFGNNQFLKFLPDEEAPPLTYEQARASLLGTVRMETPVLYFYATADTDVDVQVRFPKGLITEWYPSAMVKQPATYATMLRQGGDSVISWQHVGVHPESAPVFLTESNPSHYYAARQTGASPVQVGMQNEKFLFYRGVGGFQAPITTTIADGDRIVVKNPGQWTIPNVVLFENHDGQIGYRVSDALRPGGEVTLDPPVLASNLTSLRRDLVNMLVATGLYDREAQAMVDTWRDSWFETGTRVFYVMPRAGVDAVLPLTIDPAPSNIARAFVGRVEVITPEMMHVVSDAIARTDSRALEAYGRFLGPITDRLLANASALERGRTLAFVNTAYRSYVARLTATCK